MLKIGTILNFSLSQGLICNRSTKSRTKLPIYSFCYHQMMWHLLTGTSTCHATSSFSAALGSPRGTKIDLTNSITLEFNGRTILQHLCKDMDYFEFNIKLGTNMQNGYNVRD